MENYSRSLSNQELSDALKVTFVFSLLANSIDNVEDPQSGEKIGEMLGQTFMDLILANSVESSLFGKEEFNYQAALEAIMPELERDFDGVVEWSDNYFEGLERELKIRILSVVYQTLLVDGNYSENESKFFEEGLASSNISLEEIQNFIQGSIDWKGLSEEDFE
ncbi:MAG: hypothetical protein LW688_05835 [Cryomorphaceae bacterium]|jgi:hypothetical protein|nr:hypothetical protein [Cryomorphaceae bacterium]